MTNRSLFLLLLFVWLLGSCDQDKQAGQDEDQLYEPSELAMVMRAMAAEQDSLKMDILRGEYSLSFPKSYMNMLEAKPSEGMHIGDEFRAFARTFAERMDSLRGSDSLNLRRNHNLVVSSCVNCHEMHCGGPIERIEKLYLK